MASLNNLCSFQTITLQAGQSFVLPPDATLLAISDPALVTSQSGCADEQIANLESLACYALVLTADQGQDTPIRAPWMEGQGYVHSYTIGGVEYLTDNPNTARIGADGEFQFGDLQTSIQNNTQISGLFLDITVGSTTNDTYDGGLGSICFKTLPSVGDSMTVTIKSVLGTVKDPYIELKVQPIDYYGGSGSFAGMCTCAVS